MSKTDRLWDMAQALAKDWPRFFEKLGYGVGDHATAQYIAEINKRAEKAFKCDYSQKRITAKSALSVDFYFPDEGTIVEIAMGLRNPNSEFERDILKAALAQESNCVSRLVFFTKPGGKARTHSPSAEAIRKFAMDTWNLKMEVREFSKDAENILDDTE